MDSNRKRESAADSRDGHGTDRNPIDRTNARSPDGGMRAIGHQTNASPSSLSSSRIDSLLGRLDRVRSTGPGRWTAKCPAHDDSSPSLALRELDDGTILLHDFGGCSTEQVLASVGLEFRDLFPDRDGRNAERRSNRKPWTAAQLLHLIDKEALVVLVTATDLIRNGSLQPRDVSRIETARARIVAVVGALP